MIQEFNDKHPLIDILKVFYSKYCDDLITHITIEEKLLLPYINCLQNTIGNGFNSKTYFTKNFNYSLQVFSSNHEDSAETGLKHIQDIILKYTPRKTNNSIYRILFSQLESFERDLTIHALIEDYVLTPRTRILERKLEEKINLLTSRN